MLPQAFPVNRLSGPARAGRCPACGRPLRSADPRVRVAGVEFHRACALYEPRYLRRARNRR
jgi:hypothetical protein